MSRVTTRVTTTLTPVRGRRSGERPVWARVLLPLWLPIGLIALWWIVSSAQPSAFFPALPRILGETWNQWVVFGAWTNAVSSLRNLGLGYVCGALLGIIGGSLLWRSQYLRVSTNPLIYFLYVLPAPALLPAMIAIFGIGDTRQIALITLGAIWPTLLNTLDGMRGIDIVKFDTAKALRLSGWRTYFSLVLPGAGPQIAAGLRASLTVSIILMVVSEMVAARSGIGFFILQAQSEFAIVKMWTGILVLALIGTALNYLFIFVERIVQRWYYRSRALGTS